MYVAIVPNRSSRPAILLRESYRDGAKENRALANLSDWSAERIETLRAALRGDKLVPAAGGLEIVRALPHGHVSAALRTARRIGVDELLPEGRKWRRKLALALIVTRLIDPAAKLTTAHDGPRARPDERPSTRSTPRKSTPRSIGWARHRLRSRRHWRDRICATGRWCSMT
jgi:hypothetical protein